MIRGHPRNLEAAIPNKTKSQTASSRKSKSSARKAPQKKTQSKPTLDKCVEMPNGKVHPATACRVARATDVERQIEVALLLRRRPSSPGLPTFRDHGAPHPPPHLSGERFAELHGADPDDVSLVLDFARHFGFKAEPSDPAQRRVHLVGPVDAFNRAFRTRLLDVKRSDHKHPGLPKDTEPLLFMASQGPIHLSPELAEVVTGVFGLDTRPVARPNVRALDRQPDQQSEAPQGTFLPPQVAQLYDFPKGFTGKGQSIAIIELGGGFDQQSMRHYFEEVIGLPLPSIQTVGVAGGKNNPGVNRQEDFEVALDIQLAGSIAPDAEIVVYFSSSSNRGFLQAVQEAVHGGRDHSVISISWGEPEDSQSPMLIEAMNEVFQEAAAKGITVCVATGDFGSSDASRTQQSDGLVHVSFPACSPYALACGGTTLQASAGSITSEVVWNTASTPGGGATGGGVSRIFPCPDYQKESGTCLKSIDPGSGTGRGIPDVAGNGNPSTGYRIDVLGQPEVTAGTSAVAPLWAGLIALINQKTGKRRGFINPSLYRIGKSSSNFRDVVEGNNATASEAGGYNAGPGWDACTGWGTPRGSGLAASLPADVKPPKEPPRDPASPPSPTPVSPGQFPGYYYPQSPYFYYYPVRWYYFTRYPYRCW